MDSIFKLFHRYNRVVSKQAVLLHAVLLILSACCLWWRSLFYPLLFCTADAFSDFWKQGLVELRKKHDFLVWNKFPMWLQKHEGKADMAIKSSILNKIIYATWNVSLEKPYCFALVNLIIHWLYSSSSRDTEHQSSVQKH